MNTSLQEKNIITDYNGFTDYFKSGFKTCKKIGIEYEKLAINKNFKAVEFLFDNGILDFLNEYKNNYNSIPYYENNIMLGLRSNKGTITLEPGCQVELSSKPLNTIKEIEENLLSYNHNSSKIGDTLGIRFIALGNQPLSTFANTKIIPKERYKFMTKYFKDKGSLAYEMMRETAGIQVSIDYSDEEDAISKLSCALKLSPFLSALFVNSPIRNGKLTEYKSNRLNAWLNTDNKRCGLVSGKLLQYKPEFSFNEYVDILLDIPIIFNGNKYFGDTTLKELFVSTNKIDKSLWNNQISLFFSDVRLKNYIEIRNHDCQKLEYALAIPAIYKGIMYSNNGIEQVNDLLKNFKYYDYEFVRQNAPRFGIAFSINDIKISDILKEILSIAKNGLSEFNLSEEKYLEPMENLLLDNMTPADIIIKNFNGSWNKSIEKLIDYSQIN